MHTSFTSFYGKLAVMLLRCICKLLIHKLTFSVIAKIVKMLIAFLETFSNLSTLLYEQKGLK